MTLLFVSVAVLLSVVMAGAWVVQRVAANCGWVDAIWTFGLGAAGAALALLPSVVTWRQVVVAVLVATWSLRLGLHIVARSMHGPEDVRYALVRVEWGARFQSRMFGFLQVQAAAAIFLALSMLLAAHNPAAFPRWQDFAAVAVLAVAVIGEGLADEQLRRFRRDHRGKVCDVGLWAWSRHPNYFFEWFGWVAYPLFAVSAGWPWGWLALSGPAFMYWLLVYVSGVPMLEQQMLKSRGDLFRVYQSRVSAFFPFPPKGGRR